MKLMHQVTEQQSHKEVEDSKRQQVQESPGRVVESTVIHLTLACCCDPWLWSEFTRSLC